MDDFSRDEFDASSSASSDTGSLKGRIICLDVGEKRVGMAISDPLFITAQPLPTLIRKAKREDINALLEIIKRHNAVKVIYGLPKNMNGTIGPQAEKTEAFMNGLRGHTNCPCIPWDERLTTVSAHKTMKEAGLSRKKRSEKADSLSALLILQNYMDLHGAPD